MANVDLRPNHLRAFIIELAYRAPCFPESTEIPLLPVSWSGIGLDFLFFNKGQFFFIQRHLQICIWVCALHSLHIVTKKIIATNKEQHKTNTVAVAFFLYYWK